MLNLQKINSDDFFSQLVDKLNQNFEIISNTNGGPEGKQGQPGITGLAGPRGVRGERGVQGVRGTKWHTTQSAFPTSDIQAGDYCIISTNGKFYEYIGSSWELRGTFNYNENITIDIEDSVYDYEFNKIEDSLKVLINAKTNQSLLLTNYDRPDEDLGLQIPLFDSAGDTYPLIQGDDSDYQYLKDYKLKVFTSANSDIDEQQTIGRNIHIANSFAMKLKSLWRRSSGFTIDVELDANSINETDDGVETLRIGAVSSGSGHLHKVEFENSDVNVGNIRLKKNGKVGIGYGEDTELSEALSINGGVNIGNTNISKSGTVRYYNNHFQGYNGVVWKNLDLSEEDMLSLYASNVTAFYDKVIDFGNIGGIILGDSSAHLPPKKGQTRLNSEDYDVPVFEGFNGIKWVRLSNEVKVDSNGVIIIDDGTYSNINTPISTLISVSTEAGDSGDAIYKGIIFTSPTNTLKITQGIFDSQYSVVGLDVNGSVNTTDEDGETVAVSSIDIVSDDIKVKKSIIDGAVSFDLTFNGSDEFKKAIAETLDIRSSDGTILADPPSGDKNYWDVKINPMVSGGISSGGLSGGSTEAVINSLDKYKNVSLRYTQSTKVKALAYSATYSGYYTYLPFETKDFDENCNIESTDPLVVSVKEGNSGFFHIDARVRFLISTLPTGTFASMKLVVIKNSTIISTLHKVTSSDINSATVTNAKYFELAGSDILDFSCDSDDCSNQFKLALITDYGSTESSGNVTIQDAYVSVHKTATITQNKVNEFLGNSNVAYKVAVIKNSLGEYVGNLSAQTLSGNLIIKEGVYGNLTIVDSNTLVVSANIDAIKAEISTNGSVNRYANVVVGTTKVESTTTRANIRFLAGQNVTLGVSSDSSNVEVTINANNQGSNYYSGDTLVSSEFVGNVKFGTGLSASVVDGNVEVSLGESTSTITLPAVKVTREYPTDNTRTQDDFDESDYYRGLIKYSEFTGDANKFVGLLLNDNLEDVVFSDNDNFTVESGYNDGYHHAISPKFNGKCRVSVTAYYDIVYLDNNHKSYPYTPFLERPLVGLYMLKKNSGGSYKFVHNAGVQNTDLVHHIGATSSTIKKASKFGSGFSEFPNGGPKFYEMRSMQTVGGSFDIEVADDDLYLFGLGVSPINYIMFNFSDVKNPDSGSGQASQMLLAIYKTDINIERIG